MTLQKRVGILEKRVDNNDKRLSAIENKFDLIQSYLKDIKHYVHNNNPKKYKIIIYLLSGLCIGAIIAGALR